MSFFIKFLDNIFYDYLLVHILCIGCCYLVNIKMLSYQPSFDILSNWLKKCNSFKKLDFNPDYLVKYALTTAIQKRIPPSTVLVLMEVQVR